jgi:hypothetical protein
LDAERAAAAETEAEEPPASAERAQLADEEPTSEPPASDPLADDEPVSEPPVSEPPPSDSLADEGPVSEPPALTGATFPNGGTSSDSLIPESYGATAPAESFAKPLEPSLESTESPTPLGVEPEVPAEPVAPGRRVPPAKPNKRPPPPSRPSAANPPAPPPTSGTRPPPPPVGRSGVKPPPPPPGAKRAQGYGAAAPGAALKDTEEEFDVDEDELIDDSAPRH